MSQSVNTIYLLHKYIQLSIKADNFCIDATAGKGKDTVFLANLVGEKGHVLAVALEFCKDGRMILHEKAE